MKLGINNSVGIGGPSQHVPSDPFFDNVVLLLNAEDGLVDKSKYARTLTPIANTAVSTVWAAQGDQSVIYDAAGDSLSFDASASEMDFATNDFTIEATLRWTTDPVGTAQAIFALYTANTNNRSIFLQYAGNIPDWRASVYSAGTSTPTFIVNGTTPVVAINTEYAVALVRKDDDLILFVDGVEKDRQALSASFDIFTNTALGYISGLISPSTLSQNLQSVNLDELRVTIGVARYTADYEVATAAFPEQ